jgi:hypothetical protein
MSKPQTTSAHLHKSCYVYYFAVVQRFLKLWPGFLASDEGIVEPNRRRPYIPATRRTAHAHARRSSCPAVPPIRVATCKCVALGLRPTGAGTPLRPLSSYFSTFLPERSFMLSFCSWVQPAGLKLLRLAALEPSTSRVRVRIDGYTVSARGSVFGGVPVYAGVQRRGFPGP